MAANLFWSQWLVEAINDAIDEAIIETTIHVIPIQHLHGINNVNILLLVPLLTFVGYHWW